MEKKENFAIVIRPPRNRKIFCAVCGKEVKFEKDPFGENAWPLYEGMCCDDCFEKVVKPAREFLEDFKKVISTDITRGWYVGNKEFKKTYVNNDFSGFELDVEFNYKTFGCKILIFKENNELCGYVNVPNEYKESPDKVVEKAAVKLYDCLKKNSK